MKYSIIHYIEKIIYCVLLPTLFIVYTDDTFPLRTSLPCCVKSKSNDDIPSVSAANPRWMDSCVGNIKRALFKMEYG